MPADPPIYITTPIYYVNGLPHIGHAYTTIAADVYARWFRVAGRRVFFLTGTDEHGQKVLQTAEKRGLTAKAHVDDLVVHWKAMWQRLDIQYDKFIRTTDPDHEVVVQAVLQDLFDKGLIEKKDYEGWYHVNDEIFVTDKDVEAGKYSPDSLQRITESNYWFKMSAYQQQLIDHLEQNPDFVRPASRRNEVLGFLRQPLGDLCISRPRARMSWGIELPFDGDYVCYVWFDALLNYLSGVGYHPDPAKAGDWQTWWPATYQLLGKDILTTHSVYWSTMLMGMGVPLADCLYAHGWWTSADGDKMSKSSGNAIDIKLLVEEFGADPCRYFFLREKAFGADGGFSYEGFLGRYNTDLANILGNLAHRGLSMSRWVGGTTHASAELTDLETELQATAARSVGAYAAGLETLDFNKALEGLFEVARAANDYIEKTQPWTLNKNGDVARLQTVLRHVLEVCYVVGACLQPVMPAKSAELLDKLGRTPDQGKAYLQELIALSATGLVPLNALPDGAAVEAGDPLFPRIKDLPPAIAALFDVPEEPAPKPSRKEKKQAKKARPEPAAEITYDEFARIALKTGTIVQAQAHPSADRLLVLQVDIGEASPRQIVAGIAGRFAPDALVGRKVVVVANLAPSMLRGVESQGMLLAAGDDQVIDLVSVDADPGETVR